MKFYYENIKDATITYSGTEDTDFPISNLNDPVKYTLFKDSTPSDGDEIFIDFGTARTCDSFVMTSDIQGMEMDVAYSTGGSSYSTLFGSPDPSTLYSREFTSISARYWRITFNDFAGSKSIKIGNIFLGEMIEMTHDPEIDIVRNSNYMGMNTQSITGYESNLLTQTDVRKNFTYNYQYVNPSDKTKLETLRDTIKMTEGKSIYPLYFDCDGLHFARWQGGLNLTDQAYQAYQTTINLIGEL